ncbi:MAG: hypothetical protein JWN86_2865 [Planctomycetota bacterium]|nr:hypothetical protein [Planctomycetota bacterium]
MRRPRLLMLMVMTMAVVAGSARWGLFAQEKKNATVVGEDVPRAGGKAGMTVEEALLRPFEWPFAKETTLDAVTKHLRSSLDAPVVLDLAALNRLGITDDEVVKLELQGVRLKTGLKLLLDQVGMTYKVVSEDNLLVLTDSEGAEDPVGRILHELQTLHREVHGLQDAVSELHQRLVPVEDAGPAVRKPTIIEDMPAEKGKAVEAGRSRPGI